MKNLITAAMLLSASYAYAQSFTQVIVQGLVYGGAGGTEAVMQADHFYPEQLKRAFPGYQLAKDTWQNKYKNGDPAQGPAFFGSTTALVWLTDDWHARQFVRGVLTTGATTAWVASSTGWTWGRNHHNWYEYYRPYDRKPWWAYVAEAGLNYACYNVGKEITLRYIKSK